MNSHTSQIWRAGTLTYSAMGLTILCAWLLIGDFVWNIKERAIIPVAQLYLKHINTSDWLIGLLVGSLPFSLLAILAPATGTISDSYRSRWGRRIPFLLVTTPIIAGSMTGLGMASYLGEKLHLMWGVGSPGLEMSQLIVFALFWTLFEIASTIANIVFYALVNDVVPVNWIGKFFGLFRAVGLLAGILFNYFLLGRVEQYFMISFIAIGSVYAAGILAMCLFVKEGEYPPVVRVDSESRKSLRVLIVDYFRICFSSSFYTWVFIGMTLAALSWGAVNTFSLFYAKSIGMDLAVYGKYMAATYVISLIIAYPLGAAADRFHPLRVGLVAILFYFGIMLYGWFFVDSTTTFGIALVGHGVLSGAYMTGAQSLAQRLFPKDLFGRMFAMSEALKAIGFMLLPPAAGWLLDASNHTYRYTFLIGATVSLFAVLSLFTVYRKFKKISFSSNGGIDM